MNSIFGRDLKNIDPEWPLYLIVETVGTLGIVLAALVAMVLA
jgi:hypothetical protein